MWPLEPHLRFDSASRGLCILGPSPRICHEGRVVQQELLVGLFPGASPEVGERFVWSLHGPVPPLESVRGEG